MKLSYKRLTFNAPVCVLLWLKRRMRWVRAAGGIVAAPDGTLLLIERNGHWDLPKGKVESGETLRQAALREVEEETGLKAISIHSPLKDGAGMMLKTYHIYNLYGGWHLKQTSWFAMSAEKQPVTPQQEEGITGGEWVSYDLWHSRLQRSYGTLKTLSKTLTSNL